MFWYYHSLSQETPFYKKKYLDVGSFSMCFSIGFVKIAACYHGVVQPHMFSSPAACCTSCTRPSCCG